MEGPDYTLSPAFEEHETGNPCIILLHNRFPEKSGVLFRQGTNIPGLGLPNLQGEQPGKAEVCRGRADNCPVGIEAILPAIQGQAGFPAHFLLEQR